MQEESVPYLQVIMIIFAGRNIEKPKEAALLRIVCFSAEIRTMYFLNINHEC